MIFNILISVMMRQMREIDPSWQIGNRVKFRWKRRGGTRAALLLPESDEFRESRDARFRDLPRRSFVSRITRLARARARGSAFHPRRKSVRSPYPLRRDLARACAPSLFLSLSFTRWSVWRVATCFAEYPKSRLVESFIDQNRRYVHDKVVSL